MSSSSKLLRKRIKALIIFRGDPGSRIVLKRSSSNTVQAEFTALMQSNKTADFCPIVATQSLLATIKSTTQNGLKTAFNGEFGR